MATSINLNKNFKRAYYNRGIANLGIKNYEDAVLDFTKEIEINPKNDSAYYQRAIAQAKLEHNSAALEDYTKALELNPKNADYYADRAAFISKTNGDLDKALEDINKAIDLDKQDSEKFLTRAIINCKKEEYLPAIDDLNIVLQMVPENQQARELRTYAIKSLNTEGKN